MRAGLAALALSFLAWLPALALAPDELAIATAAGEQHFTIELAATPEERARGLMFRESMADDHGMLFDFHTEQPVAFWMKNTPMSLDMIFIDGKGRIVSIATDTTPFSEAAIPSWRPVRAVLEVKAGTTARLGIATGDRVQSAIFEKP